MRTTAALTMEISMNKTDEFQRKFQQRRLNEGRFLHKLKTYAFRLGQPAIKQLYALYFLFKAPTTPKRSKMIIVGALVYFLSPIDAIPDLLGPLGFSDDLAVIALVYAQFKAFMTDDIIARAQAAAERLLH
jgi:uncharacterized membrane protein YkvA (DUF1232 family)